MLILKVFWLVVLFMTNNLVTKHLWMIGLLNTHVHLKENMIKNFGSFFMNHSTQLRVIPTPWTNIGTRGGWETFDIGTYIGGHLYFFQEGHCYDINFTTQETSSSLPGVYSITSNQKLVARQGINVHKFTLEYIGKRSRTPLFCSAIASCVEESL